MTKLSVLEKYRQPEVVDFWRQFSLHGLQAGEEEMLRRYAPITGEVLDLGCGCGRAILSLAPRGFRVIGLDISLEMLTAAQDLCRQQNIEAGLIQADMRDLPYSSQHYDLALIFIAALQHIPNRDERQHVFAEIARALKPEGVLLLALDNLAPALWCYWFWGWQKLISTIKSYKQKNKTSQFSALLEGARKGSTQADLLLSSQRGGMNSIAWHFRGVARTLRWRTWNHLIDLGRKLHLIRGEVGDTKVNQVSLKATAGKIFYHIYQHDELVADARAAGLELLGFHSSEELRTTQEFPSYIRKREKQVMYAFRRPPFR
ncbi:MAG: class I SAM-dependent methyltransferase [Anaerolineae bacterium]|nr:class I SAM-dependent methyltransferase [Anaerolineae bacterium]